jgi:hypothetical protein
MAERNSTWLRPLQIVAALALALLAWSGADIRTIPARPGGLRVIQEGDRAPATVTVVAPWELLARIDLVASRREACELRLGFMYEGFIVHWGDDDMAGTRIEPLIPDADGCQDWRKHQYTVPGTYRIRAGLYHLGPDDAPVGDWGAETTVTISGDRRPLDFAFVETDHPEPYLYGDRITVVWNLTTDGPSYLQLDLVGENGVTLTTRSFAGLSYIGKGKVELFLQGPEYEQLIKDGMGRARIRATIRSDSGALVVRETDPLLLSSEYVSSGDDYAPRAYLVSDTPHAVMIDHFSLTPKCQGYLIDWGDGSPPLRVVPEQQNDCGSRDERIKNMHVYPAAGTYRITLRTNELHHLWMLPEDRPFYEAVTITIP